MNKKFVIKTFQIMSMTIAVVFVILGVVLALTFDEAMYTGFGIGIALGACLAGTLKCFLGIPKKYKDKDERTLLVSLLSSMLSQIVFGITSYVGLVMMLTGILVIDSFDVMPLLIVVGIIIVLTFATEKIAYKVINNRM